MIKVYLCDKSNEDIAARLSQAGVLMLYSPTRISQLSSAPIVAELHDSDAVKLAEAISDWQRHDSLRSATIRRDAEIVNSANLSTAALVYLLKSASDVHLVDVRHRPNYRIETAHSDQPSVHSDEQLFVF